MKKKRTNIDYLLVAVLAVLGWLVLRLRRRGSAHRPVERDSAVLER